MTYVITEPCIGTKDQSCVEVCPVDCIYDAGDHFMINPEECIDCGACEPECPVEAIYPEDEVPDDMESYTTKAANYYEKGARVGLQPELISISACQLSLRRAQPAPAQ